VQVVVHVKRLNRIARWQPTQRKRRGRRLNHAITAVHDAEDSVRARLAPINGRIGFRRYMAHRGPTTRPATPGHHRMPRPPTVRHNTSILRLSIDCTSHRRRAVPEYRKHRSARSSCYQSVLEAAMSCPFLIHVCAPPSARRTDLVRHNPVWHSRRRPCALVDGAPASNTYGPACPISFRISAIADTSVRQWTESIEGWSLRRRTARRLDLKAVFKLETGFQPTTAD